MNTTRQINPHLFFQWLENFTAEFPMVGKFSARFSNGWKTALGVFLCGVAVFLSVSPSAMAFNRTLGGEEVEGALKITCGDYGMRIEAYVRNDLTGEASWKGQTYQDDKSSMIHFKAGGTYKYTAGYYDGIEMGCWSNENISASVNRRIWRGGSYVDLTMDTTYNSPDRNIYYTFTISNRSSQVLSDLEFYHGQDTYLGGSDSGGGFWNSSEHAIGVDKPNPYNRSDIIYQQMGATNPAPSRYCSLGYYDVKLFVEQGNLGYIINTNWYIDNGYALQWNVGTLNPGETWTVHVTEVFKVTSDLTLTMPDTANIGVSTVITGELQNIGEVDTTVYLDVTVDQPGWTSTISGPVSYALPAGATSNVLVYVSCPEVISVGEQATIQTVVTNASLYMADNTVMSGVYYDGVVMVSNVVDGAAPSIESSTDFGGYPPGTYVTNIFSIYNGGPLAVTITNVALTGDTSQFSISSMSTPLALAAGESTNVEVVYYYNGLGDHTATLTLQDNKPWTPFVMNLAAYTWTISTNNGAKRGGNEVTLTNGLLGSGADINQVLVGGVNAEVVDQGANWVTFIIPEQPAEGCYVDVTINSISAGAKTMKDCYYINRVGTFASVSPETGDYSGGYPVTITGTNFCNGQLGDVTNVTFQGVPVTSIDSVSGKTQVVVTVAAALPGPADIVIESFTHGRCEMRGGFRFEGPLFFMDGKGGYAVANNGAPQTQNGTDYGSAAVGAAVVQSFFITNAESATLHLSSISTNGADPDAFTIVSLSTTNIAQGDAAILKAAFTPQSTGSKSATVLINSDAPDAPFLLNLAGDAVTMSPLQGPYAGGQTVEISGITLDSAVTEVLVGNNEAAIVKQNSSSISFITPAASFPGQKTIMLVGDTFTNVYSKSYTYNRKGRIFGAATDDWTQWETLPDIPHGITQNSNYWFASICEYDGYVMAVGGTHTGNMMNTTYYYDGFEWFTGPQLPFGWAGMALASQDETLHLMGGYTKTMHHGTSSRSLGSNYMKASWTFDGENFVSNAPLNYYQADEPMYMAGAYVGGDVYTLGGAYARYSGGIDIYRQTNIYRLAGQEWVRDGGLPGFSSSSYGIYHGRTTMLSNKLYMVGGFGWSLEYEPVTNAYMFDGTNCTTIAGLPYEQGRMAVGVASGQVYAAGGAGRYYNNYRFSNRVFKLDGSSWTEVPSLQLPINGGQFYGGATLDGRFYAIGPVSYAYPKRTYASGVSPTNCTASGGVTVTITGRDLCDGSLSDVSSVLLAGNEAASIDSVSSTQIVVTASPGSGAQGDVVITSVKYGQSVASNAFTYTGIGIQVRDADGNLVVADQPASASAGTAYGYIPQGTPVTNWFTIENTGDGLVTFSGLSTNGSAVFGTGDFNLPATLAQGATTNLPIVCDAGAVGDLAATLYFINDTLGASSNYPVNLSASIYHMTTNAGPFQGGQTITITNGIMGNGSDITAVYFYTFAATILDQGSNWVRVVTPATEWAMTCDVTVRSDSLGDTVLADAYMFRQQAWIGGINYSDGEWKEINGPADDVLDMTIGPDGALYACGYFTNLCDGTYVPSRVAKYQYGVWTPVGTNIFSGSPRAIEFMGTDLYAGGWFYEVDTNAVYNMARYNGTEWVAVYTNRMDSSVYALETDGTNLYLGGSFDNWYGYTNVAVWDGSTLENIGNGITNDVRALKYHNGYLYAGTDGSSAGEFARWNGSTWQHLVNSLDEGVYALATSGNDIYFGGYFTYLDDGVFSGPVGYVCSEVGGGPGGIDDLSGGLSNRVTAMDTLYDGNIVAGYYQYGYVGGIPTVDNMAVWDGTGWVPCGNETAYYGTIDCLQAVYNGIYVGGDIRQAGGGPISNCAFFAFAQTNTISPKTGAEDTTVTIPGYNLGNGTTQDVYRITICGVDVKATNSICSTQIVVVAGAGPGGLGDVVVYTHDYGVIMLEEAFTYAGAGVTVYGSDNERILNGDAATVAAGTAGAAQTGSTQTNWFTIENLGDAQLNITSVSTSGANPELFHVIDMPSSVAAGTTTTFGIEFSPTALGAFSGGITINNNADGAAGTYVINLTVDGYTITEDAGPWNGGNQVTLTAGTIGGGTDITNVLLGGQSAVIVSQSTDSVTFITPEYTNAGAVNIIIQSVSQGEKELGGVYTYYKGMLGGILEDWNQWEEKVGFNTTSYSRMPNYTRAAVYSNAIYAGGGKYYYFRYTNNATAWERIRWTTTSYYTNYDFVVFNDDLLAVGCNGRTNNFYLVGTNLNNQCMGMPNYIRYKLGGAEVINGKLHYVGCDYSDIYRCAASTPDKDTFWTTNSAPLAYYVALATAALSNRMYCIGGQRWNSTTPGDVYTNVYWSDDGVNWNLMNGIPEARRFAAATTFRNQIYVMGGFTNSDYRHVNGNGFEASNVWRYTGSEWEEMAPLPMARGNSGAVVYNDQIWVMGGFPLATNIYAYPAHVMYLGAEPDNGVNTGGYDVRLWGTDLHAGTTTDVTRVTFGGADAEVLSVAGTTQVIVHVNGGPFGAQDVKIYSTLCGITTSSNAFTFTGADMTVLGTNGAEIASGEAASTAKGTDLGTIAAGQSFSRTFGITNAGDQVTTISGIATGGMAAASLSNELAGFPISLAGSGITNLAVTWTASGAGLQEACLVISNDTLGPQSNYVLNLRASILGLNRSTYSEDGGGLLTISNGLPLGSGSDITNVLFGTVNVTPYAQGSNWVTIVIPPGSIGTVSPIIVQSFSLGDHSLIDAFEYVAAGAIYGSDFAWTELPGLPQPMEYNVAFVLNDQLYSAGGYSADYATNLYRFDGITWHDAPGLPAATLGGMGAIYDGAFYYIGGDNNGTIVTNVYRFDGTNWTQVRGLPRAVAYGVAGTVGGKIVVAGGWDSGYSTLTNCYVFDGANWTETRGLRNARVLQGGAVNRGKLYAFGGQNSGASQTFNQYSFNGTNWSSEAGMNALLESMGGATLNRRSYSIGGANSGGVTNSLYRYDGVNWSNVDPLPAVRCAMGAAFWRGAIYAVGGDVSSFNPATNVWMLTDGGVSPIEGYPSGGYNVTIRGTNLSAGTTGDVLSVTLCGVTAEVVSVAGSTQIVVIAGAGDVGTGDVVVNSLAYGTITAENAFTYKRGMITLIGTNGVDIAQTDPANAANGTDFGSMLVGQAQTNVFGIRNTGNESLILSAVEGAGSGGDSFTVTDFPTNTLLPGATGQITVVCASLGGDQLGQIAFRDDEPVDPSLPSLGGYTVSVYNVHSYGSGPGLDVTPATLDYSATYGAANPPNQTFDVSNVGTDPLTFSNTIAYASAGDTWLSFAPTGSTLLGIGGTATATSRVDISTVNVGTHSATIKVWSATATNSPQTVRATLVVSQATQSITWTNPGTQTYTNETILDGTVSSGLSPTYNLVSGPAVLHTGGYPFYATYSDTGEVTIVASQAGNMNYYPATPVTQSWTVTRAQGGISLTNLVQEYTGSEITVDVTTSPTGMSYDITYDGITSGPTNVGTYEVIALINHPLIYGGTTGTLEITKAAQTISFPSIQAQKTNATVGLAATGGASGNPVTFAIGDGPGSIAGGTNLTFTGVGDVLVTADQPGNANYNDAPTVTNLVRVFSVTPDNGPYAGGNTVTITNGSFGTVTGIVVRATCMSPLQAGTSWASLTLPAATNSGLTDITLQTEEYGDILLADAYTYNPQGSIGGYDYDWTRWEEVSGLPQGLSGVRAETLNGSLYAFGGKYGAGADYVTDKMYRFDETNWMEVVSMPTQSAYHAAAVLDDAIYAIGGLNAYASWHTNVYRFDGTNWSENVGYPLADCRYLAAGMLDGKLYGVGARIAFSYYTNVFAFDGNAWTEVEGLPLARGYNTVGTLGSYLYSVGGYDGTYRTNVFRFNGSQWSEVPGLPTENTTAGAATLGEYLYVMGGHNGSAYQTNAYRFDGADWTEIAGLPGAARYLGAATCDGRIYAVGGYDGTYLTNVYRYPVRTTRTPLIPESGSWTGNYPVSIVGTNLGDGADITNVTLCGVQATINSQATDRVWITAGAAAAPIAGDVVVQSVSFGETMGSNLFTYTSGEQTVLGTNGAAIASGEAAGLAKGSEFYATLPGTALTNIFSITNSGNDVLCISSYRTNGTHSAYFEVSGVPSSVEIGGVSNFTVTYTPTTIGDHSAFVVFTNNTPDSPFTLNLAGSCFDVSTNVGPYAGGNSITITNGSFGTITNVLVGGTGILPVSSGDNWFTIVMPGLDAAGTVDLIVQTSDNGDTLLANAYTYNQVGSIGFREYDWTMWEEVVGLPGPRSGAGAAVYNGELLVYGGKYGSGISDVSGRAYRFDETNWVRIADLVYPRAYTVGGVLSLSNVLWAGGGYNAGWMGGKQQFDGTNWTIASLGPYIYDYGAGSVIGDSLFTVGGRNLATYTNLVYRFNGASVTNVANLPIPLAYHAVATMGNNLYSIGGYNSTDLHRTNVFCFNGSEWSEVAGLPTPNASMSAASLGGCLYAMGGYNGATYNTNVYCFNGSTWTEIVGLPQPMRYQASVNYNGQIYAIGGYDGSYLTNVYRYPELTNQNIGISPVSGSWTGGYPVVITGSNLCNGSDATNVTLCGIPVASIDSQSATQITVTASAASGPLSGDVRVYSISFGETIQNNAFTYTSGEQIILGTNASAIASGEAAGLAKGSEFYATLPGTGLTNIFSITNSGNDVLSIDPSDLSDPTDFSISGVPATVDIGAVSNFTVTYTPTTIGDHTAFVTFTNDSPAVTFILNLAGSCFGLSTNIGPYAGGNSITITNGSFGTITNVLVGGTGILPVSSGANWFTIVMPGLEATGTVDLIVQSSDNGDTLLANAYTYNPAGEIGLYGPVEYRIYSGFSMSQGYYTNTSPDGTYLWNYYRGGWMELRSTNGVSGGAWMQLNGWNGGFGGGGWDTSLGGYDWIGSNTALYVLDSYSFSHTNYILVTNLVGGSYQVDVVSSFQDDEYTQTMTMISGVYQPGDPADNGDYGNWPSGGNTNAGLNMRPYFTYQTRTNYVTWTNAQTADKALSVVFTKQKTEGNLFNNMRIRGLGVIANGVAPSSGFWTGNYPVVISGTNLCNGDISDVTNVMLAGTAAIVDSVSGGTQIVVIASASPAAAGDVVVHSISHGTTIKSNAFTYLEPRMLALGTNGAAMASGDAASSANGTDFGSLIVGMGSLTNTFSITNSGNTTLNISGVTTSGAGATSFTLSGWPSTIDAGAVENFSVIFEPGGGAQSAALNFANDSTTGVYVVNLAGFGLGGGIALATNHLAYTATYNGSDPADQYLLMTNVGVSAFTYTNGYVYGGAGGWLSATPENGTVATDGTTLLTNAVSISGVNAGLYSCAVQISAPDATNSPQSYLVDLTVNKADQTITFPHPGAQETTNEVGLAASATSGLTVSFNVDSGPGSIAGDTNLSFSGAGDVVVTASQAGNSNWNAAASVTHTIAVTKAVASVTLNDLSQVYDGTARTVTASTIPGGLTVNFTYDGNTWAPTNAGSYAVTGVVSDIMYQGWQTGTLVVAKADQAITFTNNPVQTYTSRVELAASATSGLGVSFTVGDGPGTITGATNLSFTATGAVSIVASQGGNANWNAAPAVTNMFMVNKAHQAIEFPVIADQETTNVTPISATAVSGLDVTFSVVSGPAAPTNPVSPTALVYTNAGTVAVTAHQPGSNYWHAAPSVTNTFNVTKAIGEVTLSDLTQVYDGTAKRPTRQTSPTGLTVILTFDGFTNEPVNVGTYEVIGTMDDPIYQDAATNTFTIVQATQTITFAQLPDMIITDTWGLSATGGASTNSVTFAVLSGPASIAGGTNLSFSNVGEVRITADQAGDSNYLAAITVTNVFNVSPTAPEISTPTASNILAQTAALGGSIDSTNGAPVTERGVRWRVEGDTNVYSASESGAFGTGAFSLNVAGIIAGVTNFYQAYAVNTSGTVTTVESSFLARPDAPTVTAPTNIQATGFYANWNAAVGATNYYLDVSATNTFDSYVPGYENLHVGDEVSMSVTGLGASVWYYYRVRAENAQGTGTNSGTRTVGLMMDLVIEAVPEQHDTPAPLGYGTNKIIAGTIVTNTVTTPADESNGTRYVCTGWTGAGSVPTNGTNSTVTFAIFEHSTLTWHWKTQHMLTKNAVNGAVEGLDNGWKDEGWIFDLLPRSAPGYLFDRWTVNGTNAGMAHMMIITADAPYDVVAIFNAAAWDINATGTSTRTGWYIDPVTRRGVGEFNVCNPSDSGLQFLDKFVFAVETNVYMHLYNPDGYAPDGKEYFDVTTEVQQQLLLTGNRDGIMDPGECVTLEDVQFNGKNTNYLHSFFYAKSVPDMTHADTDGDGIPNDWEDEEGLNPNNPVDGGEDQDGDGVPSEQEYVADTNPFDAGSVLAIRGLNLLPGAQQVEWTGGTGVVQYLEWMPVMDGTNWWTLSTNMPPTPVTNLFDDTFLDTEGYYRIRAVR